VSIRLLLDENLSERLLPLLSEQFPDSRHARLLGLGGADELAICEMAKFESFQLGHQGRGFLRLSMSRGFPPKVICLAIGNAGNASTAALLLDHAAANEAFSNHPEAGFLMLSPGAKP
jgi:predicted nuclease of predicted toxin-antitoxin system